jgi:predicted NAD/FAD-binding protein
MNILQGLKAPEQFCVTLNHTQAIEPESIIKTVNYSHPMFTEQAVAAQQHHRNINGVRGTYFCGAYWRYGFHEDGVVSALSALEHFHRDLYGIGKRHEEQRYLPRAS